MGWQRASRRSRSRRSWPSERSSRSSSAVPILSRSDAPGVAVPLFRQAPRARLLVRLAELPALAWLSTLIVASVGVRFVLALWVPAPWIFADELKYSELAKSFAATGHFAVREVPGSGVGPLYPIVIAPAYAAFDNLTHAYVLVKAINSVVIASLKKPTYLLARRLLAKPWALVAAALALAVPSMVYTGLIMTESLFYPLFLLASLGIVRALERPSATRQLSALGLIALAMATRAQAIALLAALVTAIVAMCVVDAAEKRLRVRSLAGCLARYLPTWVGLAGGLVALIGFEAARGRSPFALFGDAQGLWHQHYSPTAVARWFVYHLAELDLYVGVLPFAAFLVLATFAWSRRDRPLRIFAIASLSIVFWLLVTVAVFISSLTKYDPHGDSHVIDRYTFYVVPLLLIALLAWITRRAPGSGRKAAGAAVVDQPRRLDRRNAARPRDRRRHLALARRALLFVATPSAAIRRAFARPPSIHHGVRQRGALVPPRRRGGILRTAARLDRRCNR